MNSTMSKALLVMIIGCLVGQSYGRAGAKDYKDSCSVISSGVQFLDVISDGKSNFDNACDLEKGLICLGTCVCAPNHAYQENVFESIFGGGRCVNVNGVSKMGAGAGLILAVLPLTYFF